MSPERRRGCWLAALAVGCGLPYTGQTKMYSPEALTVACEVFVTIAAELKQVGARGRRRPLSGCQALGDGNSQAVKVLVKLDARTAVKRKAMAWTGRHCCVHAIPFRPVQVTLGYYGY